MLQKKILDLKFKFGIIKVKRSIRKVLKHELRILKFCIHHITRIGVPKNKKQNELLKLLLDSYNKSVVDLNENIKKYEKFIWKEDRDDT